MLNLFSKIEKIIVRSSNSIGSISIIIMMLMITVEVILRTVAKRSLLIADEYSGYLMAVVVYWGASSAFYSGSFVRVKALFDRFPQKIRKALDMIFYVLFIIFNTFLSYFFFNSVTKILKLGSISSTIARTPLIVPMGFTLVGLLIFELFLIIRFTLYIATGKEETDE